ncbi:hypothetical protein AWC11_03365 [Mycobacterium interjectum]|nr:hypothetical protein AWC11_03365 [Mycobacterium interjectum]
MSDETVAAATHAAGDAAVSTEIGYAWGAWQDDSPAMRSRRLDGRIVPLVIAVALAIGVAAAILMALSWPAHNGAAVKGIPVQRPMPTVQPGPDAEQQLWKLLAGDGITVTNKAEILANAHSDCRRLISGEMSVRGIIDEIASRYPDLGYELAAKSVFDGIDAYCPRFDR